jgi:hypothetical protein
MSVIPLINTMDVRKCANAHNELSFACCARKDVLSQQNLLQVRNFTQYIESMKEPSIEKERNSSKKFQNDVSYDGVFAKNVLDDMGVASSDNKIIDIPVEFIGVVDGKEKVLFHDIPQFVIDSLERQPLHEINYLEDRDSFVTLSDGNQRRLNLNNSGIDDFLGYAAYFPQSPAVYFYQNYGASSKRGAEAKQSDDTLNWREFPHLNSPHALVSELWNGNKFKVCDGESGNVHRKPDLNQQHTNSIEVLEGSAEHNIKHVKENQWVELNIKPFEPTVTTNREFLSSFGWEIYLPNSKQLFGASPESSLGKNNLNNHIAIFANATDQLTDGWSIGKAKEIRQASADEGAAFENRRHFFISMATGQESVEIKFISSTRELTDALLRNQNELRASFGVLGLNGYEFSFSNGYSQQHVQLEEFEIDNLTTDEKGVDAVDLQEEPGSIIGIDKRI